MLPITQLIDTGRWERLCCSNEGPSERPVEQFHRGFAWIISVTSVKSRGAKKEYIKQKKNVKKSLKMNNLGVVVPIVMMGACTGVKGSSCSCSPSSWASPSFWRSASRWRMPPTPEQAWTREGGSRGTNGRLQTTQWGFTNARNCMKRTLRLLCWKER